MEEIKVDFNQYLIAYVTVEENRKQYDLKDLNAEIVSLEERISDSEELIESYTKERIEKENRIKREKKSFEEYMVPYMKDIHESEIKIDKLKEEMKHQEEVREEFAEKSEYFQTFKDNIRQNVKSEKEEKLQLLNDKLKNEVLEGELQQLKERYDEILALEKQEPNRVKDEKYKEFLSNKIKAKENELNIYQEPIKQQIGEIEDNYDKLLENFAKIDQGQNPDQAYYEAVKEEEEKRRLDELNKKRVQDPDQAYDEAIKEEKRRLDELNKKRVQDPDQAYDEAIKEEKRRLDELNKKRVQDLDQAYDEAIKEEEKRQVILNELQAKYHDDVTRSGYKEPTEFYNRREKYFMNKVDEITCLTKLGIYVVKMKNGSLDYFDPVRELGLNTTREEKKQYNEEIIGDPNVAKILLEKNEFARENDIEEYLNSGDLDNLGIRLIYNDEVDYNEYHKMQSEKDLQNKFTKIKKMGPFKRSYFKALARRQGKQPHKDLYVLGDFRKVLDKRFSKNREEVKNHILTSKNMKIGLLEEVRKSERMEHLQNIKGVNPKTKEQEIQMKKAKRKADSSRMFDKPKEEIYQGSEAENVYQDTLKQAKEDFRVGIELTPEQKARIEANKKMQDIILDAAKETGIEMPDKPDWWMGE